MTGYMRGRGEIHIAAEVRRCTSYICTVLKTATSVGEKSYKESVQQGAFTTLRGMPLTPEIQNAYKIRHFQDSHY